MHDEYQVAVPSERNSYVEMGRYLLSWQKERRLIMLKIQIFEPNFKKLTSKESFDEKFCVHLDGCLVYIYIFLIRMNEGSCQKLKRSLLAYNSLKWVQVGTV